MEDEEDEEDEDARETVQRCISRGIHGLSKVSIKPAMLNLSMPCERQPLKWPSY
jgi:hypothetical protein